MPTNVVGFNHGCQASTCLRVVLFSPCWFLEGIYHYWKYVVVLFFQGAKSTASCLGHPTSRSRDTAGLPAKSSQLLVLIEMRQHQDESPKSISRLRLGHSIQHPAVNPAFFVSLPKFLDFKLFGGGPFLWFTKSSDFFCSEKVSFSAKHFQWLIQSRVYLPKGPPTPPMHTPGPPKMENPDQFLGGRERNQFRPKNHQNHQGPSNPETRASLGYKVEGKRASFEGPETIETLGA